MDLWIIFLAGLTIGGFSCLAVQGGLLASVIASRVDESLSKRNVHLYSVWAIGAFLATKLFAYTILGFFLGLFGQTLSLSEPVRIGMQLLAGLYMIGIGLHLLHAHPIFRYLVIQPPRFLTKRIRTQSKSSDIFAPALLGLLTIFIPCGTTLAMEAEALASGSPFLGALIMAVFTIGTMPLFFALGYLTSSLGEIFQKTFLRLAAIIVIYVGLSSINGSLVLMNSPVTFQSIINNFPIEINLDPTADGGQVNAAAVQGNEQVATIDVYGNGYQPNHLQVKAGTPVRLNLVTHGNLGCTSEFKIPALNITKSLPSTGSDDLTFTPTQKGTLIFSCSMGMYTGTIEVM